MILKAIGFCGAVLLAGETALLVASPQSDDRDSTVLKKELDGFQLEFFNNSPTASQALAINSTGSVIGVKEHPNLRNIYFYYDQNGFKDMPIPKGFTNVEATAVSDTNLVVGRTTKAIGTSGSLRAVTWVPDKAEVKQLPVPDGYEITDAHDISADGKMITGSASGDKGLKPVVWEWDAEQSDWKAQLLPVEHDDNPFLVASQLLISPDGTTIVGCCTESKSAEGVYDSALYEWRISEGAWSRRLVTVEQMQLKGINNKGQIAGSVPGNKGRIPCLVTLNGQLKRLDLLEGDVAGEARDINDDGIIVGWSDDPAGPDGGPTPCTWNVEGKATKVKLNEDGFGMLYAINAKGQMAGTADVITQPADGALSEEAALLGVRISK